MVKALVEFSTSEFAMEALKGFENYPVDDALKITAVRTQIDSLKSYNEHNSPDPLDSSNLPQLKDYSNQGNYFFNGFEVKSCVLENKANLSNNTSTTTKSDSSKSSKSSTSFHLHGSLFF